MAWAVAIWQGIGRCLPSVVAAPDFAQSMGLGRPPYGAGASPTPKMPATRLGDDATEEQAWAMQTQAQPKSQTRERGVPVRRLVLAATSVAILLLALVPAALAADPSGGTAAPAATTTGVVAVSVDGTLDIPAGSSVRGALVIDGSATIAGPVESLVVIDGTATVRGTTVDQVLVINGTVDLVDGAAAGSIATLRGAVTHDASSTVNGRTASIESGLAALALLLIPLALLFTVGLALAGIVAALFVAAFGARQVRDLEGRISRQPGHVLVAGIIGSIALPLLGGLLVATVIGAPVGLALLLVVYPILALVGWIVAAIWIGNWILARSGRTRESGHPYKAAVLGVVVLAIASILPLVSAVATAFGLGAMLLAGWDAVKPERPVQAVESLGPVPPTGPAMDGGPYQPAPSAS